MRSTVPDNSLKTTHAEQALRRRIARTKAEVKRVDLFSTLTAILTLGGLALLVGTGIDHFLARGLSQRGRIVYFSVVCLILAVLFIRRIFPLIVARVNPFYAADVLEKNRPTLKNALINWLGLTHDSDKIRSPLERAVLDGLTREAAGQVAEIPNEAVVDHTPVIRWGIALAAVAACLSLYAVLAPKNPFVSASRIIFPLADIAAPQRVRFLSVEPGDAKFYQGRTVPIRTEISGGKGMPVRFVWDTADRRRVDQEIPMKPIGGNLYELDFPSDGGLTESLTYRIKVGEPGRSESASRDYRIEVRPPMSFDVESVAYDFPDYTGRERTIQEKLGAVRALEGTAVTITGVSSEPLARALWVPDFALNRAASMTVAEDGRRASYQFKLHRKKSAAADSPLSEAASYRIVSYDAEGNRNLDEPENPEQGAAAWGIELVADLPPTVRWDDETPSETEIPLDGALPIQIKASDPDFALRRVRIAFERRQRQGDERLLSDEPIRSLELLTPIVENGPSPYSGERILTGTVSPAQLNLAVGDQIDYFAEALDSRLPSPNVGKSVRRTFTVVDPTEKAPETPSTEEPPTEKEESDGGADGSESGEGKESDDGKESDKSGESGEPSGEGEKDDSQQGGQAGEESKPESAESGSQEGKPDAGNESSESSDSENQEQNQGENEEKSPPDGGQEGESGAETEKGESADEGNPSEGNDAESSADGGGRSDDSSQKDGQGEGAAQPTQDEPSGGENQSADGKSPSSESKAPSASDNTNEASPQNEPSDAESNPGKSNGDPNSEEPQGQSPDESNEENPPEEEPEPIDPETNPGDAFEKILDHCCECNGGNCPLPNPEGGGTPSDGAAKNPSESQADPESLPPGTGNAPADAPRQNDSGSAEIPPDAPRERGEVDPETRNYMTAEGESSGAEVPDDAHIASDSNHSPTGTPASEQERQNAHEGGANPNGSSEGAVPAEPNGPNPPGDSDKRPNDSDRQGTPTSGGSPGDSSQAESAANNSAEAGNPAGNSPQKEGNRAGSDRPTENSPLEAGRQGTGGAGAGELAEGPAAGAADAAHLAYSEAATALALEHLEDQLKNGVDPKLLQELGWTKEQLAAFLRRWQAMKQSADNLPDNNQDKMEYIDKLLNMGLWETPPSSQLRGAAADETYRNRSNVRQSSRTAPPTGFSDRFKAYNQGISRQK